MGKIAVRAQNARVAMNFSNEVYFTKDLSMFKFFKGNRKENKSRTSRIMLSIMKKNCLRDFPIIVDSQNRILDGQNRLFAVRNMQGKGIDIGIYYKHAIDMTESDISTINCAVTTWNITDYKDMYISQGNQNYILFDRFCYRFGIKRMTSALSLFGGFNIRKSDGIKMSNGAFKEIIPGASQSTFKNGDFIYPDDDSLIIEKATMLCDLASTTKSNDAFEPSLVIAFNELIKHPEYDHARMKKQIAKGIHKPNGYRNAIELTAKLEDIYNYGHNSPIRFTRPH